MNSTGGRLNTAQGAAVSIGAVLGTGVVGLPALGAHIAGPASLIAWLALIILSIPLASTFASLGARYPDAGGVSTYVRRAFGARAAAVVGWCFFFAVPTGAPAAALFGGAYVASAFGGGRRTELLTCAALILIVTATNFGGIRLSGGVQLTLAATLVTLLVVTTVLALPHGHVANLHPFAPNGFGAIFPAAAVLVWGFAGWEAVTSLAADFRRPDRDLRRATAIAILVVGVLYLAIAATSILVLGPEAGSNPAPLSELLGIAVGGPVKKITAVVALLLTIGAMNAYFAGASKLGAALGRDGALPAWFAKGSEVGEVPRRSLSVIAVLSAVALAIVAFGNVGSRQAVLLTTGSFVLVYILGTAAAIKLLPGRTWARWAAIIAFASSIGLAIITGVYVVWALVVAGAALLYNRRRRRLDAPKDSGSVLSAEAAVGDGAPDVLAPARSDNT
jgi:amino acid efflux transporter